MNQFKNYYSRIVKHKNDPLFKNSYYLIGNTLLTAMVGFIFWIVAARLYTPEMIGISSAIISAMSLITIFSLLGLDISIIRYLPEQNDKTGLINTSFTLISIVSVVLSIVFLAGLNIWSPGLVILKQNLEYALIFIVFTTFFSLFTLQLSVFIGFRNVRYSFFQSFLNIVKLVILPLLVFAGAYGIFISFSFFYVIAFLLGIFFISRFYSGYKFFPVIKKHVLNNMIHYSFENYIANIFYSVPNFLLPLIVLNVLGPVMNAYFYISWTFSTILLTVPFAVSRSLLAEGSSEPSKTRDNLLKTMKFSFIFLLIANTLIIVFGRFVLSLFGSEYASNAYLVLILFSLSSFPFAVVLIFTSLKRIKKEIIPVITVNMLVAVLTVVCGFVLMQHLKLIGMGYAWLAANILTALYVMIRYRKEMFTSV